MLAILRQQNQVLADLAARLRHRPGAAGGDRRTQVADFIEQGAQRLAGDGRAPRRARGQLRRASGVPRGAAPDAACAWAASPTRRRRCSQDLGAEAPDINRLIEQLGPLSSAARPAVRSLGDAAVVGTKAMREIRPITQDINNLAASSAPLARDLDELLVSLRDTGGIERLHGLPVLPDDVDQRVRRLRPLPARRADHQRLRDLRHRADDRLLGDVQQRGRRGARGGREQRRRRALAYLKRQDALLHGMPIDEVLRRYPEPGGRDRSAKRRDGPATTRPPSP